MSQYQHEVPISYNTTVYLSKVNNKFSSHQQLTRTSKNCLNISNKGTLPVVSSDNWIYWNDYKQWTNNRFDEKMTYLMNIEALYKNDMKFGVIHVANNQHCRFFNP